MNEPLILMKVTLGEKHLRPGRTKHTIADSKGRREFPPFVRLEIAQYLGQTQCYLFHVCEDGALADTLHRTVEEAMDQAEWEFGVGRDEWQAVSQERSSGGKD